MLRILGLSAVIPWALALEGCSRQEGNGSDAEKSIAAFKRFQKGFSIPEYDSAFDARRTDDEGCGMGVDFKVKVGFRSDAVVEHYSRYFREAGLAESPGRSQEGARWLTFPVRHEGLPQGSNLLIHQRTFVTGNRKVECYVAGSYYVVQDTGSSEEVKALDSAQTVSVGCGPRLPPEKNPCIGRAAP